MKANYINQEITLYCVFWSVIKTLFPVINITFVNLWMCFMKTVKTYDLAVDKKNKTKKKLNFSFFVYSQTSLRVVITIYTNYVIMKENELQCQNKYWTQWHSNSVSYLKVNVWSI